jgi:hypothetical protein
MAVLLVWCLLGLVAAMIGRGKGRSGCGFFALGILLGPFGILWAMLAGRDQRAIDEAALKTGQTKKCPECAEIIRVEALKCRHCGASFAPPTD